MTQIRSFGSREVHAVKLDGIHIYKFLIFQVPDERLLKVKQVTELEPKAGMLIVEAEWRLLFTETKY